MAERVRITGKNDGTHNNEGIEAQVDTTHDALHVKSHLYGYDGIGFTIPIEAHSDGALKINPSANPTQQMRMEYIGGNLTYTGYAERGIASSATSWLLQKFTYTAGDLTLRQIAYDSWDNRATASYA